MGQPAPYLSEFDPEVSSEGGIDPLSLQATYERLAERVFPSMTVRMKRVRFVTAIAVGAEICRDLRDEAAADEKTPPWLIFEWYVVEGLLRAGINGNGDLWGDGIPGAAKVGRVVRAGHRLNAGSYLKTPKIFGFTGVYRRLAHGLNIVDAELQHDNNGIELLERWERDQGLKGFVTGAGPGAAVKASLQDAIRKAMKEGSTCRPAAWDGWGDIHRALHPGRCGMREREHLYRLLMDPTLRRNPAEPDAAAISRELLSALEKRQKRVDAADEKTFFIHSRKGASPALLERLESIGAYEEICRRLEDSFNLIRHVSTIRDCRPVTSKDWCGFNGGKPSKVLANSIRPAIERLSRSFVGTKREDWVAGLIKRYGEVTDPETLFSVVMTHHVEAQGNKPPNGKASWFEQDDRGAAVRTLYAADSPPSLEMAYVHDYRSRTASDFLVDLKRLAV